MSAGAAMWAQSADVAGDRGITNFMTTLLSVLAGLIFAVWWMVWSRSSRHWRLGVAAIFAAAGLGIAVLCQVDGYTGALVPRISWRFGGPVTLPRAAALRNPLDIPMITRDDFPGFLGSNRDAAITHVELNPDWDAHPPQLLWRQPIGAGWSGFAIVGAYAFTMELRANREAVTAYKLATGELLWSHEIADPFDHVMGGLGPRATPTVHDGLLFALGARGQVVCLNASTGTRVWSDDILARFDISDAQEQALVQYGRSNSPLVVDGMVIVPGGGSVQGRRANLVAYDMHSGAVLWEGPSRQISFSSPSVATLGGIRQILIVNEDTMSGHRLSDGAMLWEWPWPGVTAANANVSQAVALSHDRVFVSKGYGGGATVIQVTHQQDGSFGVEEIWHYSRVLRTKFTNIVIYEGHAFGLSDGILECVELQNGTRAWKSGRYHHGQILRVGHHGLILSEDGDLVAVQLAVDRPNQVWGQISALHGMTWNNLAFSRGILAVRNGSEAAAYRLSLLEPAESLRQTNTSDTPGSY
jgi:outer membrane protein assembly factor BamB